MADGQKESSAQQAQPLQPVISRPYNVFDWYWLAEDGRVFSSKRQLVVDESDAAYAEWANYGQPTPWPRDDSGSQTDQALQDVFDSYDIKVGGQPARFVVRSNQQHAAPKSKGR
jgi:hypothetical protein